MIRRIQDIKKPGERGVDLIVKKNKAIPVAFNQRKEIKINTDNYKSEVINVEKDAEEEVEVVGTNKKSIYVFIISVLIMICFFAYIISFFLNKVNIIIKSKHQVFTIEKQNVNSLKGLDSKIPFEIMSIDFSDSVDLTLLETANISKKASGEVTIYNDYSKKPLIMKSGIFISDPSGKTYTLNDTIEVPGFTKDGDKKSVPGSIDAKVTAFLAGESYNNTSTDFYFNDFKNDSARYKYIYAKSKGEINGGFSGFVYIVNDADKKILEDRIKTEFKKEMIKKMKAQVPDGYILYEDSIFFDYKFDDNTLQSKNQQAKIVVNGTIKAPILKKKNLDTFMLKKYVPNKTDEEYQNIEFKNVENLVFNYNPNISTISKDTEVLDFQLTGDTEAIWHPNRDMIKNNTLGKTIDESLYMFQANESIGSASVRIFPFWLKKIPLDSKKVKIIVK